MTYRLEGKSKEYAEALGRLVQEMTNRAIAENQINGTPMPTVEEMAHRVMGLFGEKEQG